jgi:hypothetical protein
MHSVVHASTLDLPSFTLPIPDITITSNKDERQRGSTGDRKDLEKVRYGIGIPAMQNQATWK